MQEQPSCVTDPIVCTAARLERIADTYVFGPMGISPASVRILKILAFGKDLTPGQILASVGGTKSNVSQRLRFLEKEGLVRRIPAGRSGDRRRVGVTLTAAGRKKLEAVRKRFSKANLKLEGYFTKAEVRTHLAFFRKLNELLDAEEKNLGQYFPKQNAKK
jgi:DNA-binding MarR family transcriptional regulator